ncbi:MAG: S8 family serine peptidase, partial [Dehalococcoidia bacterium]|nr:S8 family serine peptidase [Dehalococcoidia bacterium]
MNRPGFIVIILVLASFLAGLSSQMIKAPLLAVSDVPATECYPAKGSLKMQDALEKLFEATRTTCVPADSEAGAIAEDTVRIITRSASGKSNLAITVIKELGGQVESTYGDLVQAVVPVSELGLLSENEAVKFVQFPSVPTPLTVSEGASLSGAVPWHDAGLNGTGVKIGIIDIGFSGYSSLLGTELPAEVATHWAPSLGGPGPSSHGTASSEIVHDMAPSAQLYLANFRTEVEWGNSVNWLIGQGVSIISSSVGFANTGPGDGTGPVCDAVKAASDAGILWSQAAGDGALRHWSGQFLDVDGDDYHDFGISPADKGNAIYAKEGERVSVFLKWDDPWQGSRNDYDLYLFDSKGNVVASSMDPQAGSQNPKEQFTATIPATGEYYLSIYRYYATRSVQMELMTYARDLEYWSPGGSLLEPADSANAVTIGAVPWGQPDAIEQFSSRGPTTDGRIKPDLVAPDGVSTATYGPGMFSGTSAAAPHAAGAAALVRQRFPSFSISQIRDYLSASACDLGDPGVDNVYGNGRLTLGALSEITVTKPNGGETWPTTTEQTISWSSFGVTGSVSIQLSRDGGTTWTTDIGSVPVADGMKKWTVTGPPTSRARVRVEAASGPALSGQSDSDFTITGPPPPTISVTSPNGGETWVSGSTHTITWTSTSVTGNVRVELSRNSGSAWSALGTVAVGTGKLEWKTTGVATTHAMIRVSSISIPAAADTSDGDFTITGPPPPTISVTSPNGGETWVSGSTHTITWTSTSV